MQATLDFLLRHGYLVVFLWVLVGQAGLPLPAVPVLLAAGALAGTGQLDLGAVLALSTLACLISDTLWFYIGRRGRTRVLALLCRFSLEPDSCVRSTQSLFARRGAVTVVLGKFVPGVNTMAPPLAGASGMRSSTFLWLDTAGALLWTAAFVLPGYAFADQLERLVENAALTGAWLLAVFAAAVFVFVFSKLVRRHLLLRSLRLARVTPAELERLLVSDSPPFLVDLRRAEDVQRAPVGVPGALHLTVEQIETLRASIPRDRDVVLYCT